LLVGYPEICQKEASLPKREQRYGENQMKSATIRQRTSSVENQAVISAMPEPTSCDYGQDATKSWGGNAVPNRFL
jgi:hypothetical protein